LSDYQWKKEVKANKKAGKNITFIDINYESDTKLSLI